MSLTFQGIVHLDGEKAQVNAKARKYQAKALKDQKGPCVSYQQQSVNGKTTAILLNGEDALAFWKDQGVDAELKQKFQWLHPIRSFKAMLAERQELKKKLRSFTFDLYDRLKTYAKKHPESDLSGKPVIRISC